MPGPPHQLIGFLAAVLTTSAFVPQVLQLLRTRDTRAISLWMYILFCSGLVLWGVYGVLLGSWPIIVANAVTLALGSVVLVLKVGERRRGPPPA